MNPRALFPGSDGRLSTVDRRPGETLHDYLIRCQWEMGGRIRLLETVRDGQEMIFFDERARWRRRMILLALGEAGFAMVGYLLIASCGIAASVATPLTAAMIGLFALLGAAIAAAACSTPGSLALWTRTAWDKARSFLWWLMTGDDMPDTRRVLVGVDPNRPETIDAIVEEHAAEYLEMQTFLWRLRWLLAQIGLITAVFVGVQIARGAPPHTVIEDTMLIAIILLFGGSLLLFASDFVSTNLARLARRWRRR